MPREQDVLSGTSQGYDPTVETTWRADEGEPDTSASRRLAGRAVHDRAIAAAASGIRSAWLRKGTFHDAPAAEILRPDVLTDISRAFVVPPRPVDYAKCVRQEPATPAEDIARYERLLRLGHIDWLAPRALNTMSLEPDAVHRVSRLRYSRRVDAALERFKFVRPFGLSLRRSEEFLSMSGNAYFDPDMNSWQMASSFVDQDTGDVCSRFDSLDGALDWFMGRNADLEPRLRWTPVNFTAGSRVWVGMSSGVTIGPVGPTLPPVLHVEAGGIFSVALRFWNPTPFPATLHFLAMDAEEFTENTRATLENNPFLPGFGEIAARRSWTDDGTLTILGDGGASWPSGLEHGWNKLHAEPFNFAEIQLEVPATSVRALMNSLFHSGVGTPPEGAMASIYSFNRNWYKVAYCGFGLCFEAAYVEFDFRSPAEIPTE